MNVDIEKLEDLWEKVRSHEASPQDLIALKQMLSSPEGRAAWRSLSLLESQLTSIYGTSTTALASGDAAVEDLDVRGQTVTSEISQAQYGQASNITPLPASALGTNVLPGKKTFRFGAFSAIAALVTVAFLLSLQLGLLKGPSQNKILGHVLNISGEVRVKRGPIHITIREGMAIKEDDHIITGLDGELTFYKGDGSVFTVAGYSRLHLGGYVARDGLVLQLAKGAMSISATPQERAIQVELPKMKVEVLGTRFLVHAPNKEESRVDLFEGKLLVSTPFDQLELQAQQSVLADDSGLTVTDLGAQRLTRYQVLNCDADGGTLNLKSMNGGQNILARVPYRHQLDVVSLDPQLMAQIQSLRVGDEVLVRCEPGFPWSILEIQSVE